MILWCLFWVFLVENVPLHINLLLSLHSEGSPCLCQKLPHYFSAVRLPQTFGWKLNMHSFKKSILNVHYHLIGKGNEQVTHSPPLWNLQSNGVCVGGGASDNYAIIICSNSTTKKEVVDVSRQFIVGACNLEHSMVGWLRLWLLKPHCQNLNLAPLFTSCGMLGKLFIFVCLSFLIYICLFVC